MSRVKDKPEASREKLVERLSEKSRELSTVTVLFHHWISQRLGLNTIDHKCLDIIVRAEEPITGVQLARLTGLSSGTVTGVIDRLEKAGYVIRERDRVDRRLVFVKPIMKKIEKEVAPIFNSLHDAALELYSHYSDKDLSLILDFTNKCITFTNDRIQYMMTTTAQKNKNN